MNERSARRLVVRGRVQGVGYRMALRDEARALGLAGWVRNRRDGSVEAVVQGRGPALEAIVAWARRGPPAAAVSEVRVEECEGEYTGFEMLPTV